VSQQGHWIIVAMASTHLSLNCHLIFSTKDRAPIIAPAWRDRLHAYMGGVIRNVDGVPEAIGGVADHVHVLIGLRATARLSDVVRDLKAVSSRWVHGEVGDRGFSWQEGYGAFTVSASQLQAVKNYIVEQEAHHQGRTFQEEYLELLKRSGVNYNGRFVWLSQIRRPCQGGIFFQRKTGGCRAPANVRCPSGGERKRGSCLH
jgi:putative transposase